MSKNCTQYSEKKFNIQQLTRLKEDTCYLDVRNKDVAKPGKYVTSN